MLCDRRQRDQVFCYLVGGDSGLILVPPPDYAETAIAAMTMKIATSPSPPTTTDPPPRPTTTTKSNKVNRSSRRAMKKLSTVAAAVGAFIEWPVVAFIHVLVIVKVSGRIPPATLSAWVPLPLDPNRVVSVTTTTAAALARRPILNGDFQQLHLVKPPQQPKPQPQRRPNLHLLRQRQQRHQAALALSKDDGNNSNDPNNDEKTQKRGSNLFQSKGQQQQPNDKEDVVGWQPRRATIAGVSVERHSGFWVVLQLPQRRRSLGGRSREGGTNNDDDDHGNADDNDLEQKVDSGGDVGGCCYWAVPMTHTYMDRAAATSGPALTLVQLLSELDMAGVVFPPNRLAELLICGLEEQEEERKEEAEKRRIRFQEEEGEETTSDRRRNENEQKSISAEAVGSHDSASAPHMLVQSVQQQIRSIMASFSRKPISQAEEEEEEDDDYSYGEASPWIRSRINLPLCTLDQLHLNMLAPSSSSPQPPLNWQYRLDVVVTEQQTSAEKRRPWTYQLNLTESTVAQTLLEDYQPIVSRNFMAVALALRYRAPVVIVSEEEENDNYNGREDATIALDKKESKDSEDSSSDFDENNIDDLPVSGRYYETLDALKLDFPQYVTVSNLQQSSNRVVQTIERSFEWHKWQAAWKIARQKQDFAAMVKIRAKLDELDQAAALNEEELPVQPESQTDQME